MKRACLLILGLILLAGKYTLNVLYMFMVVVRQRVCQSMNDNNHLFRNLLNEFVLEYCPPPHLITLSLSFVEKKIRQIWGISYFAVRNEMF